MNESVTKFVESKILKEFQPIINKFRLLVKNEFPLLTEEMRGGTEKYYGVPVYRLKKIILTLSPTKNGITFSFTNGKMFKDKYSLLEGVGNKSLNLRISSAKQYNEDILRYYLTQAIKFEEQVQK